MTVAWHDFVALLRVTGSYLGVVESCVLFRKSRIVQITMTWQGLDVFSMIALLKSIGMQTKYMRFRTVVIVNSVLTSTDKEMVLRLNARASLHQNSSCLFLMSARNFVK